MTLTLGARLGPYEIQAAIGAGGIGEVYKARPFVIAGALSGGMGF